MTIKMADGKRNIKQQDFPEFQKAYKESIDYLLSNVTPELCKNISPCNFGFDSKILVNYMERSWLRYKHLLVGVSGSLDWLEIGAFLPTLPIALAKIGHKVTVVEDMEFYPEGISALYEKVAADFSIKFVNRNLTTKPDVDLGTQFDCVSLMAVLEHLPYTPRYLLENIRGHLRAGGRFFIDVPNVHFALTIYNFLRGRHILPPIESVYRSEIPFTGHHREYTRSDLRYILREAGFDIRRMDSFNYSHSLEFLDFIFPWRWPHLLSQVPSLSEIIFVEAAK